MLNNLNRPKILISILNWNKASQTLICLNSLASDISSINADVTILVIDNGSKLGEADLIKANLNDDRFRLLALPHNLGFTGGHNVAIRMAIDEKYDFVWLLNNDATLIPGALTALLVAMREDIHCGAASPVIRASNDLTKVTSCLGTNEWKNRECKRIESIEDAYAMQMTRPESVWIPGTAALFRVKALVQIGSLDDRLFAYWDDNDIGARLSFAGWKSKCVFNASVAHDFRTIEVHPLYIYYLYQRNEMLFWWKNTPKKYRKLLWLKIVDTALFDVNRLYRLDLHSQGDAALLGVFDFIFHKFGPPELSRKPPYILKLMCKLSALLNERKVITHDPRINIAD